MKKRSFLVMGLIIGVLFMASAAYSQESISAKEWTAVVEQIGAKGKVNWSGGYIEATGIGAPPERFYGKPQARPMALRAAQVDAYRNLLEVVQGVRVDSETEVKDFTVASDVIKAKVEGLVKGAQLIKRDYLSDGTVEVTLRMPLYGESAIANVIMPLPKPAKAEPTPAAPPAAPPAEPAPPAGPQVTAPPPAPAVPEVFTGLVVDARGVQLRPTMKPKILDEGGQEVYGYMMVDQTYANQQGISSYSKDLTAAQGNPRVTNNPLTVKALRSEGPTKGDVVIGAADASKISGSAENMAFLKKCRVMIVLD